jgi:hypothetical protein
MLIAPRCIADVRDNMNMERYAHASGGGNALNINGE